MAAGRGQIKRRTSCKEMFEAWHWGRVLLKSFWPRGNRPWGLIAPVQNSQGCHDTRQKSGGNGFLRYAPPSKGRPNNYTISSKKLIMTTIYRGILPCSPLICQRAHMRVGRHRLMLRPGTRNASGWSADSVFMTEKRFAGMVRSAVRDDAVGNGEVPGG